MKKLILILSLLLLTACSGKPDVVGLTPPTSNNEDPSIIEVDGKYYMAWFSNSSGFADIWVVDGDGKSWSEPRQVTSGEEQDFYPTLSYDNGVFHISFFRIDAETKVSNIWYAKSTDGIEWEEEEVTSSSATDWTPRVLAHEGKVYIVWSSNRSGNRDIFITVNEGEGWSTPQQLTNSSMEEDFPYLTFIDGEFYLAWSQFEQATNHPFGGDGSKIVLSRSKDPLSWPVFKVISDERKKVSDTLPVIYKNESGTYVLWTSGYKHQAGDIVRKKLGSPFYEYITKNPYPDYSAAATGNIIIWSTDPENDGENHIINLMKMNEK